MKSGHKLALTGKTLSNIITLAVPLTMECNFKDRYIERERERFITTEQILHLSTPKGYVNLVEIWIQSVENMNEYRKASYVKISVNSSCYITFPWNFHRNGLLFLKNFWNFNQSQSGLEMGKYCRILCITNLFFIKRTMQLTCISKY